MISACWIGVLASAVLMFRGIAAFLGYSGKRLRTRFSLEPPAAFPFQGREFWLDRDERGLFAFSDRCPHLGCRPLYRKETEEYVCPCHGSRFRRGGEYLSGPAGKSMQRIFVVRQEDGSLLVDVEREVGEEFRV